MCKCVELPDGSWHVDEHCAWVVRDYHAYARIPPAALDDRCANCKGLKWAFTESASGDRLTQTRYCGRCGRVEGLMRNALGVVEWMPLYNGKAANR